MTDKLDFSKLSDEQLQAIVNEGKGVSGLVDIGRGFASGGANATAGLAGLPGDVETLLTAGANALRPEVPGVPLPPMKPPVGLPTSPQVRGWIENLTGPLPEPKTAFGKMAKYGTELSPAAVFPGGPFQRAMNVVGPALGEQLGGYMTNDSPYGKAAGALAGGVLGMRGLAPASATPERARLATVLANEGVPMTAGQRTGNRPLMWFEQAAADTPFAGGTAQRMNEAQGRAFSGAVMRRIGASGDEIATPEAVDTAVRSLSQRFEDLASRNTMQADRRLADDLTRTTQTYVDSVIPSQQATGRQNIDGIVRDVVQQINANGGTMTGELYQATRSRLSRMADGTRQTDPQLSQAIGGIRDALDDAMGRSIAPADRVAWQEARTQWKNWKALEQAMSGAGSQVAEGFVSPSHLRSAVANQNRGQYTRGGGDMGDVARAGEAILRPLPQSGTAPRLAAQGAASVVGATIGGQTQGGEGALVGAAAPWMLGRALLSRPVQAYLGAGTPPMSREDMHRRLLAQQLLASSEARQ